MPEKAVTAKSTSMTAAERSASIAKMLAEAEAANAAAEESRASAREHDALAKAADLQQAQFFYLTEQARIESEIASVTLAKIQREERFAKVNDLFHKTYHFDDVVTDRSVHQALTTLVAWSRDEPGCAVTIYLSSPGGDVIAGMNFIDGILALRREGHAIKMIAVGLCASMSAFMLQAATTRAMGKYATLLLHEGSLGVGGTRAEVEDSVAMTDKLLASCWGLMAERALPINDKTTVGYLKKFVKRKDVSLTAQESLELGLVDEIL